MMKREELYVFSFPSPFFLLEAPGGFEPPHKGFADLSLTTWVRRQNTALWRMGRMGLWLRTNK